MLSLSLCSCAIPDVKPLRAFARHALTQCKASILAHGQDNERALPVQTANCVFVLKGQKCKAVAPIEDRNLWRQRIGSACGCWCDKGCRRRARYGKYACKECINCKEHSHRSRCKGETCDQMAFNSQRRVPRRDRPKATGAASQQDL